MHKIGKAKYFSREQTPKKKYMTPTITNNESVILHKFPFRHRFAEIDCTKLRQSPSHFVIHSKTNTQITYLSHKKYVKRAEKIVKNH